jgi:hypothetical protein
VARQAFALLCLSGARYHYCEGARGGKMQRLLTTTVLVAALAAAACGGKSGTPTAPSSEGTSAAAPSGPVTPGSATITGRVQSAGAGATVAVAGSPASTGLDSAGNFTLRNVTPGDVQLRVTSASANAMVPLAGVQAAQTVEIVVTMAGSSANVESEVRHGAGEAELKGVVEALPPTTPALAFKAAGKTVVTNASTVFVNGSGTRTFADLKLGARVEAQGSFAGDTLTAARVEIEDHEVPNPGPNPGPTPSPTPKPEQEAELSGAISALTGSASSFQFTIGSRLVKGDATTTINGSSNAGKTFADLKNGVDVEVKGVQKDGFVQASRIHLENEAEPPPGPQAEAEVEGTVSALTGSASAFQFTVGSTLVKGDSKTTFGESSKTTNTFTDLKNGVKVEVKGVRATDGSVQAARIQIENGDDDNGDDNDNENEADAEGTLGAVTGTCPAIASTVGSTKFTTSASTRFDDACSSFKAGDRVEVKGSKNTDGSIAATRLRKK